MEERVRNKGSRDRLAAGLRLLAHGCTVAGLVVWQALSPVGAETRVLASSDQEVVLEVVQRGFRLIPVEANGRSYHRIDLPGGISLPAPGSPDIPVLGEVVGIPPGVKVSVQVTETAHREYPGVLVLPVPDQTVLGDGASVRLTYRADPTVYGQDRFLPASQAAVTTIGLLRDQQVAALSIRPVQYNPARRLVRVATRMRIALRFDQDRGRLQSIRPQAPEPELAEFYRGLLPNDEDARRWRGRRRPAHSSVLEKTSGSWFDPAATYYKLRVTADGVYGIDASWFSEAGISFQPEDLGRVQLYLNGEEVPLYQQDGVIYFSGRYRRAPDRDFESDYGRENTYWLTVGLGSGLRYQPLDASPSAGYPAAPWFTHTTHAEVDSLYDPLGLAADVERDHFYWQVAGSSFEDGPITPALVDLHLPGIVTEAGQMAAVRVAMHGRTAPTTFQPDHRAMVQAAGTVVSDDRWDGQTAFVASGQIPALSLAESTRVTLTAPGAPDFPQGYVDQVLLNWVEVTYPRRFEAQLGQLTFSRPVDAPPETYSIGGFETPQVLGFDTASGRVLEGISVTPEGTGYQARFQLSDGPASLILADADAVRRPPEPELDDGVDLTGASGGAAYLIVTHPVFREAADRLADHRRSGGLTATVVEIEDVYDAFTFGQLEPSAVRSFVAHAFQTWATRPVYLLLLGRAGFDHKDIFKQAQFGRQNRVPAMPYQAVNRGLAFSDHPFGSVAGDDDFLDVFVGRISVNTAGEAAAFVDKIIAYDETPGARWRDRILYMANYDEPPIFTDPSDDLAATFTEPFGLETFKVYNEKDTPPQPNEDTQEVIRQINEGRLIVSFMGHGSVATMQKFISGSYQQGNYSYMSRILNGNRLPLVLAMSCLNGQFGDTRILSLSEEMTKRRNGGAIAYVSAAALAFHVSNLGMSTEMFRSIFTDSVYQFGESMAAAKTRMVSASPVLASTVFGYNLIGDPAQSLAVPGAPDLALEAGSLRVEAEGEIVAEDTTRIRVHILNAGRTPGQDVTLVVTDRNTDTGVVDTLFLGRLPAFGQADSVAVLWPLAGRAGTHLITARVDPKDNLAELDETNNVAEIEVSVFGALTAVATMPAESQVMSSGAIQLVVRSGASNERSPVAEFELGLSPDFAGTPVSTSGLVAATEGIYVWQPTGLTRGDYYWRTRLSEGDEVGPWTQVSAFSVAASAPDRQLVWRQDGAEALRLGSGQDVMPYADGAVGRVLEPPPIRVTASTRESEVTAEGISGSAVVCSDGTYLYTKRFYTAPPIYPGSDLFLRIGTGLGGTVAGRNYGPLSKDPVNGISATYHVDGHIYADDGARDELVRISVATGQADRIQIPDGLLEFKTGLALAGHSLITSDGVFVYNVASGVAGNRRTGWSIRVFDPSDDWRLVREYQAEPTATGFTYLHTDGILADGRYLYLIEFGTGLTHRVRVLDARDGRFVTEYDGDQAETDILGGQYDWVNNKVWLGQLNGGTIYGYGGRRLPESGSIRSSAIGPATGFDGLQLQVRSSAVSVGRVLVDVLGEEAPGIFSVLPDWAGLETTTSLDLSSLPPHLSRIRLRAHLFGGALGASPALDAWEVRYRPVSDVSIVNLKADPTVVQELAVVSLTVDILNRGPLDRVLGTVVAFYSGMPGDGRLIGREAIPEETPVGRQTPVIFEWNTAKFAGSNFVSARAEDLLGRPTLFSKTLEAAEPVEITPSGDKSGPDVTIAALDASGEVRTDDYLPAALRLSVLLTDSSGIDTRSVSMYLAGPEEELADDAYGDRVQDLSEEAQSLSFIYATDLTDGDYVFEVSGLDQLGNGPASKTLSFKVSSELRIERALSVPNPMSERTAFTYILSRPSEVAIRIYTISGRLVRILDSAPGLAGYNQADWDGRDSDGHLLANGVYLYTVTADDGNDRMRVKERLIIYR